MSSLVIRNSIKDISEDDFLKMNKGVNSPFSQYNYLHALEASKSVSPESGWEPHHFLKENDGKLIGFMPVYKKYNSNGEFVFDYSWSHALQQAGRSYYPKLLTAIPYTPCKGERLLGNNNIKDELVNDIKDYMANEAIESWHILFPDKKTKSLLRDHELIERFGCRFVWKNRSYKDFNDFLNIFTSRQRKTIRAERRKILQSDITFKIVEQDSISKGDWDIFYGLYCQTYIDRWQRPYLTRSFFDLLLSGKKTSQPVLFFAIQDNEVIGSSLCFKSRNTLYGRHWGSSKNIDCLHFETCYYQGIEYCIKNNLDYFDPGVQGEHKIRRGFEPELSSSFHYLLKKDLRNAINEFCLKEKYGILEYKDSCDKYTPIKKEYRI